MSNEFSTLCWAADKMNVPVTAVLQAHMIMKYGTSEDEAAVQAGKVSLAEKYNEVISRKSVS